jgi:serine/threonine protein kinase
MYLHSPVIADRMPTNARPPATTLAVGFRGPPVAIGVEVVDWLHSERKGYGVISHDHVQQALGPFDDFQFLGSGTFGQTYRVKRGMDVFALKVIHISGLAPYMLDREVEALRRLTHPNVMGFRSFGYVDIDGESRPYLECEYIDGPNVFEQLQNGDMPQTPAELHAFLSALLSAARELSHNGIVHRDVKPQNIALQGGSWLQPVLLDFGVAKVVDMTSHTRLPAWRGTWQFMAPEQLRGRRASYRSDLFAIATVAYLAGTGAAPYHSPAMRDPQELLKRILRRPPADPRSRSRLFDDAVAQVVLRLLSPESHQRLDVDRALADLGAPS